MTGWRIGAITAPKNLILKMQLLLETTSRVPFIRVALHNLSIQAKLKLKMVNNFDLEYFFIKF